MDLVNQTPLPARVETSQVDGMAARIGMLTAKATFRFDLDGRVGLDTQQPFPLFPHDIPTPLGLLPSDAEPRRDDRFEVILLGHAHAPSARPVEQLTVALAVGPMRREISVHGDRCWTRTEQGPAISRPQRFTKVPLTWQHAFGGTQPVQIDASSFIDVADPVNPQGRGFDAERMAHGLADSLRAPAGYPVLPNYRRALPNLEHPAAPIARWDDAPEALCWATMPRDVLVNATRRAQAQSPGAAPDPGPVPPTTLPSEVPHIDPAFYRAHPDWVLAPPRQAPVVRLENLTAERPLVQIQLPEMRVVADYVVESRRGSRALNPLLLVILPDEGRLYILYSTAFTFPFVGGDERSFRLRLAQPWYPDESPPTDPRNA
jgi:hypothetical protein